MPCERATVQPTVQSTTTAAAVTPGGSTPTWAMHKRTIGLTRERATRTRLMRLAREVGARVPCERATVQPTVQSTTTAAAVTPGGSTPTWAMHKRTIGLTRERATRTRLMRFAREVGARVPCERATVQPTVQSTTTGRPPHLPISSEPVCPVPWWTFPGYIGWSRRRRGPGRMAPLHGSLQQPEGPPDSPVSSALSGHR